MPVKDILIVVCPVWFGFAYKMRTTMHGKNQYKVNFFFGQKRNEVSEILQFKNFSTIHLK